jgi:fucose 4-O-acetylase-like acetyltransferase
MPGETVTLTPSNASRHPPISRESRRDESLDIAKGFGILLVVLGHCLDGLIVSGFLPSSLAWPALAVFVIYLFHMPLFFVVSGHLASGKHRPADATLMKLLPTIVYPYFLWSILEGLAMLYLSKYTNGHEELSSLYKILWIPLVPYWFLYALFLCHAAYLVIRKLSYPVQLTIASVIFLVPQFFATPLLNAHLLIVLETVRGFLYFILGVVSVAQVKHFGRWTAIAATILFILFAIIFYQSQLSGAIAAPAALPAGISGIIATLAWSRMLATRRNWLVSTLAFFGRYSMSIYVMHIFFTAGTRIALKRLSITGTPTITAIVLEIVAAIAAGVALPLAINWAVSKFDLDKWFGLQHMETI